MLDRLLVKLDQSRLELGGAISSWASEHAFKIIIILLCAWLLRRFGGKIVSEILRLSIRSDLYPEKIDRDRRYTTLNSLVKTVMRVMVYFIAFIMLVDEIGIDTAPLLASAGILGVALGFGAQSLIKDFITGLFIIAENQYRVGDIVELGAAGGVVEAITMRTTVLRDMDGDLHHIPNGTITLTTNKTMHFGSINENIVVNYDTDIDKLIRVVNEVGQDLAGSPEFKDKVMESPHFHQVRGFAENGVIVKIVGRTEVSEQWNVRTELYKRLMKAFEKHKIEVRPVRAPS